MCVSGGKKCSFFGKFDVLCFLETPVLSFALLPYLLPYQRTKINKCFLKDTFFRDILSSLTDMRQQVSFLIRERLAFLFLAKYQNFKFLKSPHLFSQFKRICSKIFVDFCCFKKKTRKSYLLGKNLRNPEKVLIMLLFLGLLRDYLILYQLFQF